MSHPAATEAALSAADPPKMWLKPIHPDNGEPEVIIKRRRGRPVGGISMLSRGVERPLIVGSRPILKPGDIKKTIRLKLKDVVVYKPSGNTRVKWLKPGSIGVISAQYYAVLFPDIPKPIYLAPKHLKKYKAPKSVIVRER